MRKYNLSSHLFNLLQKQKNMLFPEKEEPKNFNSDILDLKPEVRTIPELAEAVATATDEKSHSKYVLALPGY